MYLHSARQVVPLSVKEVWDFFSHAKNLKELTPPEMKMQIINEQDQDQEMYAGMVISYTVSPLLGIRLPCSSEITQVKLGEYFIDSMIEGPFKIWHHQHFFKEVESGTEIIDMVHYQLPFGLLGKLFQPIIVKQKVKGIFEYRKTRIKELFSSKY
ncbi:MAG: ligand-binding SRPBCC domain-containing protein [Roseivirga sp.]|jgi:ligand-binding SRPBCC domain-containing protein